MLQSGRVPGLMPALFLGVAVMAGCADSATGPTAAGAVPFPTSVSKIAVPTEEVCEDITFEGQAHGTVVTNQFSVFGNALTFAGQAHLAAGGLVGAQLRIYAGTHVGGPDFDLESGQPGGLCATCTSNMLVIQEPNDPGGATSDATFGGQILITGFPAGSYIKSFQLADHEATEALAQLIVDGVNIAGAQADAANAVQTVNTTQERVITGAGALFILGNPPTQQGSEAIDNIEVCQRVPVLGDEGCTPGFWKNHLEAWAHTAYTTGQTLENVFDVPDAYGLDNVTLLAALDLSGGPDVKDKAALLLHHAVAALLNASHGLVDYPQTAASIIAETNAALASGNKTTMQDLKNKYDTQNNAGCPINGKEPLPN